MTKAVPNIEPKPQAFFNAEQVLEITEGIKSSFEQRMADMERRFLLANKFNLHKEIEMYLLKNLPIYNVSLQYNLKDVERALLAVGVETTYHKLRRRNGDTLILTDGYIHRDKLMFYIKTYHINEIADIVNKKSNPLQVAH